MVRHSPRSPLYRATARHEVGALLYMYPSATSLYITACVSSRRGIRTYSLKPRVPHLLSLVVPGISVETTPLQPLTTSMITSTTSSTETPSPPPGLPAENHGVGCSVVINFIWRRHMIPSRGVWTWLPRAAWASVSQSVSQSVC